MMNMPGLAFDLKPLPAHHPSAPLFLPEILDPAPTRCQATAKRTSTAKRQALFETPRPAPPRVWRRSAIAPRKAPCPRCGKPDRRKRILPPRRVRTVACKAVAYLEITGGEHQARCDCCTTFRSSPDDVLPRAAYDKRFATDRPGSSIVRWSENMVVFSEECRHVSRIGPHGRPSRHHAPAGSNSDFFPRTTGSVIV